MGQAPTFFILQINYPQTNRIAESKQLDLFLFVEDISTFIQKTYFENTIYFKIYLTLSKLGSC